MDTTTKIQTWLTLLLPTVILIITQLFSFLEKHVEFKRPNQTIILKDQFEKVLVPLHRLLNLNGDYQTTIDDPEKKAEITKILTDNYLMAPLQVVSTWNEILGMKKSSGGLKGCLQKIFEKKPLHMAFADEVDECYRFAAKQLGYAQTKAHYRRRAIARIIITTILASACLVYILVSSGKSMDLRFMLRIAAFMIAILILQLFMYRKDLN